MHRLQLDGQLHLGARGDFRELDTQGIRSRDGTGLFPSGASLATKRSCIEHESSARVESGCGFSAYVRHQCLPGLDSVN